MKQYDVLVAGAGPAGIAAALEAARSGAKTALVERYGCVGGNLTTGYVGPILGAVCEGTIAEEIEAAVCPRPGVSPDFETAKCALTALIDKSGTDLYLQSLATDVKKDGGHIESVVINGKTAIGASVFIDATGDGTLSVLAGCPWKMGREGDGLVQPVSLMFIIDGIDPAQEVMCFHEEHHTLLSTGEDYLELCHRACREGELPPNVNIVRLYATGYPGERMVNASQENRVDPLDPFSVAKAEASLRKQIPQITAFLRKHVPGFENIRVRGSSSTLGVRESRRIIGRHILTAEEMSEGVRYPDTVVHRAHFSFDTHNPAGPGQAVHEEKCPPSPPPYDIPFGAMCPLGTDNLITAGRCISGTHKAMSSYRVMRICMAMGQAAGAAAYLTAKEGTTTDGLDAGLIREHLIRRGVKL